MVIISRRALQAFTAATPAVGDALAKWYEVCREADWSSIADLRRSFNDVDYVGDNRFVFNIKGNQYRLVAMIFFNRRTVYIRFIGTHRAYEEINVKTA